MWENIIKASPHKSMARKIIKDYLESIDIYATEFIIKDIRIWAEEQTKLYKDSNGKEGANYESLKYTESGPDAKPENIGIPISNAIAHVMKEEFIDSLLGQRHSYRVERMDIRQRRDWKYRRVK